MVESTAAKQDEENLEPLLKDETSEAEQALKFEEMMQLFGRGLQKKFDDNVSLKEEIEQRWLDDLRHYHGVYDRKTAQELSDKKNTSKIFVNLTRSKCNAAESKWSDLVLPTDDRNWGLKPTPVPSLANALTDETPVTLANGQTAVDPDTEEPYRMRDVAQATIDQAEKAARLMEQEIDDQLTEVRYNPTCRDIIHDAVVMGTGCIKGPMIERRVKKAWVLDENSGQWVLNMIQEVKPTAERVDPWNLFPDMSAVKWEDCEFVFERHLMTRKQLRNLAKQPGFMARQIGLVLQMTPDARSAKLSYLNELREISGITAIQNDRRYQVIEYHGPIQKEDLIACGCEGIDIDDELESYEGVVWLCQGVVIKVGLNHMDSEELPYNILNWEKDDTTVFGFGVPYRMRAPQKAMNASWRMILDNAGLSTGPQILINRKLVEPADGVWELAPRKIWWMESADPKMRADYAMQTFDIDSKQIELTNIFELAHRLADEETSVPQMQMGNMPGDAQQPAMLKTLGGTALWMSANNIMMRRAVKNFDDDITVPFLTRFYDWNMQFNKKNEIKGDYSIDPRGTSVLLVREMQARNILEFVNAALVLPGGAEELDTRGVLKNMAKGMQIATRDVMRSDDDAEIAERQKEENPPVDPEVMKLQLQQQMNSEKIQWEREKHFSDIQRDMTIAENDRQRDLIQRDIQVFKIISDQEVSLDKAQKDFSLGKYNTNWDIKKFYEEMAIKEKMGETANYGLGED